MLALLKLVPLRWWLYLAGAAAIGLLVIAEHHAVHRANELAAKVAQAEGERDAARVLLAQAQADAKLNRETSHVLQDRLSAVERDRIAHPLRLRCLAAAPAAVSAQSGSAAGADAAAGGRVDGSADLPTFDAGPGLSIFQQRCARNAARQLTLQDFETARTH